MLYIIDILINMNLQLNKKNDKKEHNKLVYSSRIAINELNELRDLICSTSLEEIDDYCQEQQTQINIITEEEEINGDKVFQKNNINMNDHHNTIIPKNISSNNISPFNSNSKKNKKPKPPKIKIIDECSNNNDNILITSPLYRKQMENLNSITSSNNYIKETIINKASTLQDYNVNIKDLKTKFESNKSISQNSQDYSFLAQSKSGFKAVGKNETIIKKINNSDDESIVKIPNKKTIEKELSKSLISVQKNSRRRLADIEKNSYDISISNNLNFLKSQDSLESKNILNVNTIRSYEHSPLHNNYLYETEGKRNVINSVFSISGSINGGINNKIVQGCNKKLNDISQNNSIGNEPNNNHNESFINNSKEESFLDITKSNLFENIFNISPLKTLSTFNLDVFNKNQTNTNVIVSNRSTKQKELTDLLETSKKEYKKEDNNDDLNLLELMDG
ncbi:hypothetical protein BCR36DRAFT_409210 [Piromyces finnis]|uniref:Uncharacterized protein n=1 Tax=Piromyces finnis TaxID=1754191 RepID=A0A1Y1VJ30_9FUNG|nr:hypothetical protein BCR36DRAFT_409210 [Piromyces finnis]|eukprot:ORX57731.1 hypothetical protein BCR36DRAFT_409210 [Piromyces finnis]